MVNPMCGVVSMSSRLFVRLLTIIVKYKKNGNGVLHEVA